MTTTPSRRTVLRAAAWTAPAVTVVAAAPAFAASTSADGFEITVARLGDGNVDLSVRNLTSASITVAVELPRNTATASLATYRRPRYWSVTADTTKYVATIVLAGSSTSERPFGVVWNLVSGDGAYDMIATSSGLPTQVLSLPWSAGIPG